MLAAPVFLLKMGLVLLAGLNALWFHARGSLQRLDRDGTRLQTVVSMGLWLAVICGRWIAAWLAVACRRARSLA